MAASAMVAVVRTSHQYGSNAAGMREAAAEAVAAAAGLRGWSEERSSMTMERPKC